MRQTSRRENSVTLKESNKKHDYAVTSNPGIFSMKVELTDCSASWGHGWNQSMAVQFTRAGNFLARVRNVKPTGEKHKTTWRPKTVHGFSGKFGFNTAGITLSDMKSLGP